MKQKLFVREKLKGKEEKIMKKILLFVLALAVCLAMVGNATAFLIDFEDGVDGASVTDITGVTFVDTYGYVPLYADCSLGTYDCSDMNGSYDYGDYYIYDNIGMRTKREIDSEQVIVDFTSKDGTWFTTGYSADSIFSMEAFLTDGTSVYVEGASNYGVGMDFLTVAATSGTYIDYVVLYNNNWFVDNMSGDASGINDVSTSEPIPEPGTLILLGSGLVGLAFARRKMK